MLLDLFRYGILTSPANWLKWAVPRGNPPLLLCWPALAAFALAALGIERLGAQRLAAERRVRTLRMLCFSHDPTAAHQKLRPAFGIDVKLFSRQAAVWTHQGAGQEVAAARVSMQAALLDGALCSAAL